MRIAICDDNQLCIQNIEQYLERLRELDFEYDIFYDGESLLKQYSEQGYIYDAVFLDMELGNNKLNGINIANKIRSMDSQVVIVFITNHKKYAIDSFVCEPFRFLVKPVDFEEFKTLFLKILEKIEKNNTTLSFKKGRQRIRLLYEDILFLQSIDHRTCIQTKTEVYDAYIPLSDLINRLNSNIFVQVHRSYVININYISSVLKNKVFVRGYSHSIPVSNKYKKDFERKVILLEERERLS